MITENTFTGEYLYSIDDKGRVNIPAKFRAALSPDNENTFIITRGYDPCVIAYPFVEWQKVENGLRKLSSATKVYRAFIRSTVRYATPVSHDKQGRIQITPPLREWAGLNREIIIIGMVNKIEIWDPVKLDEFEKTSGEIEPEQFEDLADKIIL